MNTYDRDMFRVLCGAGAEVIARREAELVGFEQEKCLNPFRKELVRSEIARQRRELEELRRQWAQHPASSTGA